MQYKTLCSDLDGTLLTTKSDVSDFTIAEIARIKKHVQIILVSARMPKAMTYLQRRLGIENEPIICYNGAFILHGSNEIASTIIPIEHLEAIHDLASFHFIKLGLYYKNEWYVDENTERVRKEIAYTQATPFFRETRDTLLDWKERAVGAHKIMLMGQKTNTDRIFPELQQKWGHQLHFYRSNDTLIEVAPKTVSKLSAIEQLLPSATGLRNVIAFGDNYNDIEMLKKVGLGVAVANAREEVQSVADRITLKNTEDGVAHFIKEHLLF
ncbi:Cof-type HAD-IIB family hydrolase [Arenibacter sp. GZD96]|uniref:Cof-type HAD-IIB family hydrolase n=1 Tax=Aurantibrevibacter litoralis TaxID=3106030 RepID=UPI002AFFEDE0|nr:Cof-type HAD-IIB family hydrolase [Arenibacter sp. GZD-96]MEA1787536.1 Cof-type HAD-IIB family hydrolase [Arenibacter sp. GZD-96]